MANPTQLYVIVSSKCLLDSQMTEHERFHIFFVLSFLYFRLAKMVLSCIYAEWFAPWLHRNLIWKHLVNSK